jgi:hypothetical protein
MQIELQDQINILNGRTFHIDPPGDDVLIFDIAKAYHQKLEVFKRRIEIASTFLAAGGDPRPGVDYGQMAAEAPKLNAFLESADQKLAKDMALIVGGLLDERHDSKNRVTHLLLTKEQRSQLLYSLTASFEQKLDEKNQSDIVGTAALLKKFLSDGWKSSDEPWE